MSDRPTVTATGPTAYTRDGMDRAAGLDSASRPPSRVRP